MLKVGDTVKFTHMHENDMNQSFTENMLNSVGKIGTIVYIYNDNEIADGELPYSGVRFEYGVTWLIYNECLEKGHLEWIKDED